MEEQLKTMKPDFYSKAAIIERHRELERNMEIQISHKYVLQSTDAFAFKKPIASDNSQYSKLTPIPISNLSLNTTHTGRKLVGTLIVDASVAKNAHCAMEDDYGRAIKIQLPNPFINISFSEQVYYIKRYYPKGARIAILEPFYKEFKDGILGVRVDRLQEIIFDVPQVDLKEIGNAHYKNGEYSAAKKAYMEALEREIDVVDVMNNTSNAYWRLKKYDLSLYYALYGVFFHDNQKSLFRAAKALSEIDHPKAKLVASLFLVDVDSEQADELRNNLPEPTYEGPETITLVLDVISSCQIVNGNEKGTLLELKAKGNEYFKNNDLPKAIEMYTSAIVQSQAKALVSNLSLTLLTEKNFTKALQLAALTLLFDPTWIKSHVRLVKSYIGLEWFDRAQMHITKGLKMNPNHPQLVELNKIIDKTKHYHKPSHKPSYCTETDERHNYCNLSEMELINSTAQFSGLQLRDVPNYALKYSSAGLWPAGIHINKASYFLKLGNEVARSSMSIETLKGFKESFFNIDDSLRPKTCTGSVMLSLVMYGLKEIFYFTTLESYNPLPMHLME